MPTSLYAVDVRCSLQEAFDYVSDVTRHPEWASDRMQVHALTPGPPGQGSRYRTIGHSEVWNVDNTADVTVTRFEPPSAFEIVCQDPHGEFRHLFTFAESPDGHVRIERHYTVPEAQSEEARRRVESLMATVIEPARRGAMNNLARQLEAAAAKPA